MLFRQIRELEVSFEVSSKHLINLKAYYRYFINSAFRNRAGINYSERMAGRKAGVINTKQYQSNGIFYNN